MTDAWRRKENESRLCVVVTCLERQNPFIGKFLSDYCQARCEGEKDDFKIKAMRVYGAFKEDKELMQRAMRLLMPQLTTTFKMDNLLAILDETAEPMRAMSAALKDRPEEKSRILDAIWYHVENGSDSEAITKMCRMAAEFSGNTHALRIGREAIEDRNNSSRNLDDFLGVLIENKEALFELLDEFEGNGSAERIVGSAVKHLATDRAELAAKGFRLMKENKEEILKVADVFEKLQEAHALIGQVIADGGLRLSGPAEFSRLCGVLIECKNEISKVVWVVRDMETLKSVTAQILALSPENVKKECEDLIDEYDDSGYATRDSSGHGGVM
ncbi:MAG: hypothetical protein M1530_04435 [Candidatus Marsarchaeota archaeon]|nr:hypothetical protein [Candidatus Marsarchaeota archaeon]